uniref:Uncharacterized protein n=1 Tax=Hucho hucho TaxID=62062 RepID=A0A4W5LP42_9TELE
MKITAVSTFVFNCLSVPLDLSSLIISVRFNQASASPVPSVDVPPSSGHLQPEGQRALKRMARMTPLWRTMGTKPYGAYCQNNYECSTGICRVNV